MKPALRRVLLELAGEDARERERLAADPAFHEGYHPEMEAVHRRNAARLREILDGGGWPSEADAGVDGAEAAWLVAQHAIGEPGFQRCCLAALEAAVAAGQVPAWQAACLEDRIRMFEGRPQRFGTQLEPDENGAARPYRLEDPERVDEWRRAVGLEPLADRLAREPPIPLPRDRGRFERAYAEWLVHVGWRK